MGLHTILIVVLLSSCIYQSTCQLSKVNVELNALLDSMWNADPNWAEPDTDIKVNLQGRVSRNQLGDVSPKTLFSSVNEAKIMKIPTFKAFVALLDNYITEVGKEEVETAAESKEVETFLSLILDTKVMQLAHKFLIKNNLAPADVKAFKQLLRDMWFTTYRRRTSGDSCGFEHVFVGESRGREVIGFHNWLAFYLEEKSGRMNYFGHHYMGRRPNKYVQRFTFDWSGKQKPVGTLLIGSTPEFEMAMYSVVFLMNMKSHATQRRWPTVAVKFGPIRASITCHKIAGNKIGTCYLG